MNLSLLAALAIALVVTRTPTGQLPAQSTKLQTNNIDLEVARVRKQLREIQDQPIAHEAKIQQQRALIERESARVRAQMREIQVSGSKDIGSSKGDQQSKDQAASARDRRKASLENLQKLLDILHSMSPQLQRPQAEAAVAPIRRGAADRAGRAARRPRG